MVWPEDARHREVVAALHAWAREIESVPYSPGLDIDALVARHYAEQWPATSMVVTATADATIVAVTGEVDLAGSHRLRGLLAEEIGLAPRALILDLTRAGHCCARAMAVLFEATGHAHVAGVPFAITGCPPVVLRAVDALGLGAKLPIHRTTAEAFEWLELLEWLKIHH